MPERKRLDVFPKHQLVSVGTLLFLCTTALIYFAIEAASRIWRETLNEVPEKKVDWGTIVKVMQQMRRKDMDQVFQLEVCSPLNLGNHGKFSHSESHYPQIFRFLLL